MNTNQGERMDQERIAELRKQASEAAFGEWFEVHFADWLRAMRGGFRHDDIRHFRDSLLTAWSAALRGQASRKSIPSPRVLREGMVEVPAEEWAAMSAIGYDPEPCRHDHHGYCQEHGWFSLEPCPTGIMHRLRAANEKGEVTPAAPAPAP